MKNNGEHIVEKLIVEVTTASSRQGYAIKNNARSFIDRCIVPAIERYIAELEAGMDPEQIIQIDRLSIDIDSATSDLDSSEVDFTVRQEFEKAMQRTLEELETMRRTTIALKTEKSQPVAGTDPVSDLPEFSDKLNIRTTSPEIHGIAGLFYFLEHGTRPWWSKDAAQFNALLDEQSLLEIIAAEKIVFIRELLAKGNSRTIRRRLIRQFSDDFLAQLLTVALESHASAGSRTKQVVDRYFSWKQSLLPREALWQTIMQTVLLEMKGQQVTDRSIARELLKHVQQFSVTGQDVRAVVTETIQVALELLHGITGRTATKQQYEAVLRQIHRTEEGTWTVTTMEDFPNDSATTERPVGKQKPQQNAPVVEEDSIHLKPSGIRLDAEGNPVKPQEKLEISGQEQLRNPEDDFRKEKQLLKEKEQPAEQELFEEGLINEPALQLEELIVDNAGLILLHPFLKYFFSAVGVLGDGDILSDLPLAAHLLHYIATGRECDYEHSMLLEKYLVGIPQDQIIERNVPIDDALKEEVEGLLNAFKQNWPKMSGSSNDAIRETFLQRQAKLLDESPQPRLIVERKTVDILLEELNWTISIIRFPWMEAVLYVEW